jgi:hypothetical protein
MMTYGGGGIAPPFLTSALGRGDRSSSGPCLFTPGEMAPGNDVVGGWMVFREKRQISCPCLELNPDSSVVHPVA